MAPINAALDKTEVKLNQNVWVLLVSYAALGAAEHWQLTRLRCLALIMAVLLTILVSASMAFYTYEYCVRKWVKARGN